MLFFINMNHITCDPTFLKVGTTVDTVLLDYPTMILFNTSTIRHYLVILIMNLFYPFRIGLFQLLLEDTNRAYAQATSVHV